MSTTPKSVLQITQDDLHDALKQWEEESRLPGASTREQMLAMTPEEVARTGVAFFWPLLERAVGRRS